MWINTCPSPLLRKTHTPHSEGDVDTAEDLHGRRRRRGRRKRGRREGKGKKMWGGREGGVSRR